MKEFPTLDALLDCLDRLGARHVYCKMLAENDNTKQQIYLGKSFDVLKLLKFGSVRTEATTKRPNFKADVPLFWIDAEGHTARASGAQLILYPDYPEVRLSGFLRGCPIAPSHLLQPIEKSLRRFNNGPDGRVMFFAITSTDVYVYLAAAGTPVANAVQLLKLPPPEAQSGTLQEITRSKAPNPRDIVLAKLRTFSQVEWHASQRLSKSGVLQPYLARNGGGYTLEALFEIIPNGRSAPDFMGWEIKAYSRGRVTLMTPEPDAGFYGVNGVEAFLRKYGRPVANDVIYFTGSHKAGIASATSGHTLNIAGFNAATGKVTNVSGGIELVAPNGSLSASWSFAGLIDHWGRKHAAAVYVPYIKSAATPPQYKYKSPVLMGEGTEFALFLQAMSSRHIIYDPASKLMNASSLRSSTKARSQFRISIRDLHRLYLNFQPVPL